MSLLKNIVAMMRQKRFVGGYHLLAVINSP